MSFNGDNATSNDKQTKFLNALPNSFNQFNRVRCFNHTMQLSAKALLKPFSGPAVTDDDDLDVNAASTDDDDDLPALEDLEDDSGDENDDDNDEGGNDEGNDKEEEEDALEILDAEEREALLENTAVVRTTLDKVSQYLSFLVLCCLSFR
jgi:hypothetical protein